MSDEGESSSEEEEDNEVLSDEEGYDADSASSSAGDVDKAAALATAGSQGMEDESEGGGLSAEGGVGQDGEDSEALGAEV